MNEPALTGTTGTGPTPTDPARADAFFLSDYAAMLRRRWRLIAACTLLGTLVAVGYIVVGPKAYTATATVYVTPNAANTAPLLNSKSTTVINMDNEAQVVQSTSVARIAARTLNSSSSPNDLLNNVSVVVPTNTTILQISCSASAPKDAAACAQAFANAYLSERAATASGKVQVQIVADEAKIKQLESKLPALLVQVGATKKNTPEHVLASQHLVNTASQIAPLRAAVAALGASNNYQAGYIISAAVAPTTPSSPRKLLYGPSGLMAGLLIGLALAFAAERRDRTVHAPADVERFCDLPVLLAIEHRPAALRTTRAPPRSGTGRVFTEFSRVVARALGDGSHVVLVVAATANGDSGIVAANLAAGLARTQSEVILVRAEGEGRVAPVLAGRPAGGTLAAVVDRTMTIDQVAQLPPDQVRLRIIPAGSADVLEDLPADAGKQLIAELAQRARYVVIAADAVDGAGLSGLAELADAAILVAAIDTTGRDELAEVGARLHRLRTEVLGAVVLPPPGRISRRADERALRAQAVRHDDQPGRPAAGPGQPGYGQPGYGQPGYGQGYSPSGYSQLSPGGSQRPMSVSDPAAERGRSSLTDRLFDHGGQED